MNNLCSKCKIEKDEIEFHSKNKNPALALTGTGLKKFTFPK